MNDKQTRQRIAIAESWLKAAADLDIIVVAPFLFRLKVGEYPFIALIEGFGSSKGTLICLPDEWDDLGYAEIAEGEGYFCSGLYPESYSEYERKRFIDTLEDWGWFGPETEKPLWLRMRADDA